MAFGNLIFSLGSPVSGVAQNYDSQWVWGRLQSFNSFRQGALSSFTLTEKGETCETRFCHKFLLIHQGSEILEDHCFSPFVVSTTKVQESKV